MRYSRSRFATNASHAENLPGDVSHRIRRHDSRAAGARAFAQRGGQPAAPPPSHSRIKTYDVTTKNVVEVYSSAGYFESPDFSADGKYIRFNGNDKLYQIPVTGGGAQAIGPADIVFNHDRGRSRDGKWQAAMNGPDRPGVRCGLDAPCSGRRSLFHPLDVS